MASVENGGAGSPNPEPTEVNEIFLTLRPVDRTVQLSHMTVYKSMKPLIEDCVCFYEKIGLCINVHKQEDAEKLLELKELIDGTPVSCRMHPHHNVIRRVVNIGTCDVPEDELQQELADQGVINVRKIKKTTSDGQKKNTEMLALTYPRTVKKFKYVKFGKLKLPTFPYYPDVQQCFKCWEFRHIKPACPNEQPICGTCSGPHETIKGKLCRKKPFCKKCQSHDHPISSRKCPKYETERAISHIRINKDVSYWAAKEEYEEKLEKDSEVVIKFLNAKVTTMEADLEKKDREIKVLRAIYEAMKLNEAKTLRIHQLQEQLKASEKPSSKVPKAEGKVKKEPPKDDKEAVGGAEKPAEEEQSGTKADEGKVRRKKKGKKGRGK